MAHSPCWPWWWLILGEGLYCFTFQLARSSGLLWLKQKAIKQSRANEFVGCQTFHWPNGNVHLFRRDKTRQLSGVTAFTWPFPFSRLGDTIIVESQLDRSIALVPTTNFKKMKLQTFAISLCLLFCCSANMDLDSTNNSLGKWITNLLFYFLHFKLNFFIIIFKYSNFKM